MKDYLEAKRLEDVNGSLTGVSPFNVLYMIERSKMADISAALSDETLLETLLSWGDNVKGAIGNFMIFPFEIPLEYGAGASLECGKTVLVDPDDNPITGLRLINTMYDGIEFSFYRDDGQNFLDYEPYTKYELYLPFVGKVPIRANRLLSCKIDIRYVVSMATGDASVYVTSCHGKMYGTTFSPTTGERPQIIYQTSCQVGFPLEFGTNEYYEAARTRMLKAAQIGASIPTGSVPPVSSGRSKGWDVTQATYKVNKSGNKKQVKEDVFHISPAAQSDEEKSAVRKASTTKGAGIGLDTASDICSVLAEQADSSFGGSPADITGIVNPLNPQLFITKPHIHNVQNYGRYIGWAVADEIVLGEREGFCRVGNIHMDGFPDATVEELEDIENQLKAGVILPPVPTGGAST